MTRVLAGVGDMLQARSPQRLYWIHIVWIVNVFVYLIVAWWIFYRWRYQQSWTFYLFIFVLISPTILYLASLLLFPQETVSGELVDYRTHFYSNHRAFFVLMALFGPIDMIDSALKGLAHFRALGWTYTASSALFLLGLTTAAITRNERYHGFYAIFFLVQTLAVSFVLYRTL